LTTIVDGRLETISGHDQPMAAWRVLLRDHHAGHAGYITWRNVNAIRSGFVGFVGMRSASQPGRAKPGRGGRALLAGLLRCRRCGRLLQVAYTTRGTVALLRQELEDIATLHMLEDDARIDVIEVSACQPHRSTE
jgi:hypothetical protein